MIKQFFKDSAIYGIGAFVRRGAVFVLLLLYARFFTRAEYGLMEMLILAFSFLNTILPLQVTQGVGRSMADVGNPGVRAEYASTGFWFTTIMFLPVLLFAATYPASLSDLLMGSTAASRLMPVAALSMILSALSYVIGNQLRWERRPMAFAFHGIGFAIGSVSVGAPLVVFFDAGVGGFLWGQVAGASVALMIGLVSARSGVGVKWTFKPRMLREMLGFSAPLVLSSLAIFFNQFTDRLMLRSWLGVEVVGLYGGAMRIAGIGGFALSVVQTALMPLVYSHYRDPKSRQWLARLTLVFLAAILPGLALIVVFSKGVTLLLLGETFESGARLVPWLAVAVIMAGSYVFAPGIWIAKRTRAIASLHITAALLNIGLNATLIPRFGELGAAIATAVTAMCTLGLYIGLGQREFRVPYPFRRILLGVLPCLVFVSVVPEEASLYWRAGGWLLAASLTVTVLLSGWNNLDPVNAAGEEASDSSQVGRCGPK